MCIFVCHPQIEIDVEVIVKNLSKAKVVAFHLGMAHDAQHRVVCRELGEKVYYFAYIIASAFRSALCGAARAARIGQKYGQFYEHVHLGATNGSLRG